LALEKTRIINDGEKHEMIESEIQNVKEKEEGCITYMQAVPQPHAREAID
jgi:hypothetical protein